jgi:hypothetical protein
MAAGNPASLEEYAFQRDALVEKIRGILEGDARFAAAWLGGSLGRGDGDAVSDIDLFAVVAGEDADALCARQLPVASGAPAGRLALFRRLGRPASIHENHHNAPAGGTFSAVLYHQPPIIVDWVLVPRRLASRPVETRLLFDRAGIPTGPLVPAGPLQEPGEPLSAQERSAERLAFFWMMAMVTAKYIVRGVHSTAAELFAFTAGEIAAVIGDPLEILPVGATLTERLRALCDQVEAWSGSPAEPRGPVDALLTLSSARRLSPGKSTLPEAGWPR